MLVGYMQQLMVKVSAPFASSYNNSYLRVIKNGQLPMVSKSHYFRLVGRTKRIAFSGIAQASFELPNLRKLFAASRSEQEESAYSRTAVSHPIVAICFVY